MPKKLSNEIIELIRKEVMSGRFKCQVLLLLQTQKEIEEVIHKLIFI